MCRYVIICYLCKKQQKDSILSIYLSICLSSSIQNVKTSRDVLTLLPRFILKTQLEVVISSKQQRDIMLHVKTVSESVRHQRGRRCFSQRLGSKAQKNIFSNWC